MGNSKTRLANKYQIHPLSPVIEKADDISEYKIYKGFLNSTFKNPAVRNIAITGNYGIGKSRFLRYFSKGKKYLFVSGCSFYEQEKQDSDSVEYNLLYQLLLGCNQKKEACRKVRSFFEKAGFFFTTLFLLATVFLLALAPKLGPYLRELGWYNKTGSNWLHAVVYLGFAFSLCVDALWFIIEGKRVLKLKSISLELGGAKIEAEKTESESPLYKNRDALIQALVKSADKIDRTVIFEDMDRLEVPCCVDLFTKLWELNKLVNLCLDNKKPIRFVYVIHDELFSIASSKRKASPDFEDDSSEKAASHQENEGDEPPTEITVKAIEQEAKQTAPDAYVQLKFFDYILPIVPSMSDKDAIVAAKTLIQDEDVNELITLIAPYLSDYRLLRNIANEYSVFCRIYNERFNMYQTEKGIIARLKSFFSSVGNYLKTAFVRVFKRSCQERSSTNIPGKEKKRILGFSIYKNLMPDDYKRIRDGKSVVFPVSDEKAEDDNLPESIKLLIKKEWLNNTCLRFVGYNREALKKCIQSSFEKGNETAEQKKFWLENEPDLCCEVWETLEDKNSFIIDGVEFSFAAHALDNGNLLKIIQGCLEARKEQPANGAGVSVEDHGHAEAPATEQYAKDEETTLADESITEESPVVTNTALSSKSEQCLEECDEELLKKIHGGLGLNNEDSVFSVQNRQMVVRFLLLKGYPDFWKLVPGSNKVILSNQDKWWKLVRELDADYIDKLIECCRDGEGNDHLLNWAKQQDSCWLSDKETDGKLYIALNEKTIV